LWENVIQLASSVREFNVWVAYLNKLHGDVEHVLSVILDLVGLEICYIWLLSLLLGDICLLFKMFNKESFMAITGLSIKAGLISSPPVWAYFILSLEEGPD